ncbi:MAG: hypothetical protein AB7S52_12385, partial [Sphaerochaetaceae bacterium]
MRKHRMLFVFILAVLPLMGLSADIISQPAAT